MAAIAALRTAFGALRRNPVLFLGGLLYGIVVLPQSALQLAGIPLAPTALQILTFFVTPLVLAGLLGMADEAIDGDTSLRTLRAVGTDKYVPFLIGQFVEVVINVAFGIVAALIGIALVLTVGFGTLTAGNVSPAALAFAGVVGLVVLLVALALLFFIQFYPTLIVVADADALDSFTESYRFVRVNLAATAGYTLIQVAIGAVIAAPLTGATMYRALQTFDPSSVTTGAGAGTPGTAGGLAAFSGITSLFSTSEVIALSLVLLAITMLGMAFQQTYAVSFYRRHAADAPDSSEETSDDEYATVDADDGVSRADDDAEWRYD